MKESVDRELLAKYVCKECTAKEKQQVELFLFQPEWKQALEDLLKEDFETFEHEAYPESEIAAWNQRFRKNYTEAQSPVSLFRYRSWMGYAAACFLILIASGVWYRNTSQKSAVAQQQQMALVVHANPCGQRSVLTLPDGSIVHLGALSSISYPKVVGSINRAVTLTGEAFFEVTHDKLHPFTVQAGSVQTKVLGTSFKIEAFKQVVVSVATGRVQVSKLNNAGNAERLLAVLTPGRMINYSTATGKADIGTTDIDELRDWTQGKVTFANASLREITETLERWYNVDISFSNPQLENIRLSLIVKATVPIQHPLDIICSTAHLKYKLKDHQITITNNN
ncbi:LOW QUALITY PROTEIN: hypothetical protein Mucpa_2229 [Mucilaginibacter paludis DSM 18603]|uniref:Anti-FecI sigma factor, FecR n=1 Tax=Mucilaginibacter paludis DSM 18603 TaxID=714943 RepID=H1YGT4_9SPHI|nr:LOW QUALITY PROTEIN: hypothetical protein Mucpa_2229 [Mucilaginibacter paludis DSM 18603]